MTDIEAIRRLADKLATEPDPNYKDEWEHGYDAGQVAAGRAIKKLLEAS
jgi:hypothetical protein